jgi:hypothetical protein
VHLDRQETFVEAIGRHPAALHRRSGGVKLISMLDGASTSCQIAGC